MSQPEAGSAIVQKITSVAQYGGATVAVGSGANKYFGYTTDEWSIIGIFVGMAVAILGLVVGQAMSFYFRWQHLQIARDTAKADEDD